VFDVKIAVATSTNGKFIVLRGFTKILRGNETLKFKVSLPLKILAFIAASPVLVIFNITSTGEAAIAHGNDPTPPERYRLACSAGQASSRRHRDFPILDNRL